VLTESGSGQGPVAGSYVGANEHSSSTKGGQYDQQIFLVYSY